MLAEEKLIKTLKKNNYSLSIAESCTGGLLANRLTNIPGSSVVFLLGIIAYSNSAKNKILKIPRKIIQNYGAVSLTTARLMSENARKLGNSSLGVGITGLAGPGGAAQDKPVGTVFIALSSKNKSLVNKFHFKGNRREIKRKTAQKALQMLLEFIR